MAEWKVYTGSDEQLAEIQKAKGGYLLDIQGRDIQPQISGNQISFQFAYSNILQYLICEPHPLEYMICKQAKTGQPVYCKQVISIGHEKEIQYFTQSGLRIDWGIPNTEYSLAPFEE